MEKSFGLWLRAQRIERGLSQRELGQHVAYGADHIRKVEANARRFGEEQALLLVELFGIPPQEREAYIAWARGGAAPPTMISRVVPEPVSCPENETDPDCNDDCRDVVRIHSPRPMLSCRGRFAIVASVFLALVVSITVIAVMSHTRPTVPGGVWISPGRDFIVRGSALHFSARAYPTHPYDPPIAHVNFTVSWPDDGGGWIVACIVATPTAGTTDRYECDWDVADAIIPNGVIRVSFDVYDAEGNVNLAPNGIHGGTVQR